MAKANLTFGGRLALKKAMLFGKKTSTTRIGKHGEPGDTFEVLHVKFRITSVRRMTFKRALMTQYKQEGFSSPNEFKKVWEGYRTYRKRWPPNTKVRVYHFTKLRA